MDELELQIERAERDIGEANESLQRIVSCQRSSVKSGRSYPDLKKKVEAARERLDAAEVRLRALYEGKGDWVPLTQFASSAIMPAPVAHRAAQGGIGRWRTMSGVVIG
jgi:hypothetical protein